MHAGDIDDLLSWHRDRFRALLRDLAEEDARTDPFVMALDEFLGLSDPERGGLALEAARRHEARIASELAARDAAWVVFVGGDVVLSSPEVEHVPSASELVALARPRGRVPCLFEASLVEEIASVSAWAPVSTGS